MIEQARELYNILYRLLGQYRRLQEIVKEEHEALIDAKNQGIQNAVLSKEAQLIQIQNLESDRRVIARSIAASLGVSENKLELRMIIECVQADDLKLADDLQSLHATLKLLIHRIQETNKKIERLVATSLHHIRQMKRNVLGEAAPKQDTYSKKGQPVETQGSSVLLSEKA